MDPRAFERLRKWGGERLVREMVDLFLDQAPQRIAAARQGLSRTQAPEVEAAAHALKSSSAQLGAPRMQALCGKIETLARRGALAPIPELVDLLEHEFGDYVGLLAVATATPEAGG